MKQVNKLKAQWEKEKEASSDTSGVNGCTVVTLACVTGGIGLSTFHSLSSGDIGEADNSRPTIPIDPTQPDDVTKEPELTSPERPPCKDATACESHIALLTLELIHLLAFDVLMLVLVGEAVSAGPAGWVGLALVSPVIVGFYYRTWQTIGEIREMYEWRDYYNEINP
jgi:hypothetical protein